MDRQITRAAPLLFVILAVVVPMRFASGYQLFQLTMVIAYALAVLGLNLVTGYNGQVSLGHGAFYAVGAFVTAILMDHWDVPYWATLPASAVVCAAIGFLIGMPALRLGGAYLALTTFALAVAVPQLLKYKGIEEWTGGVQGITIIKPDAPYDLPLSSDQYLYLFSLAIGVGVFALAANLMRGRIGRAMIAIRDQPTAAEAMGIDMARIKTMTFATSAMFTGIGGSIAAIAVQFVSPDSYPVALSITFFVGMVIGGAASIWGAVFGAVFIQFVPNIADQISKAAPGAIYGIILIAFMFLAPGGITSLARRHWTKLAGVRKA
jgi:branched-chain amino acid transport system permease protein